MVLDPCARKQNCWTTIPNISFPCKWTQHCWPTTLNISFVSWSPKRSPTIFDPFAVFDPTFFGPCTHAPYTWSPIIASFKRCTAGPNIVGIFASVGTLLPAFSLTTLFLQSMFWPLTVSRHRSLFTFTKTRSGSKFITLTKLNIDSLFELNVNKVINRI